MAHEPVYTWTFKEDSVLIRLFTWVYAPDPKQMSFCKLFWGIVASPVTLPVRLFVALLGAVAAAAKLTGRGLGWTVERSGLPRLMGALSERRSNRHTNQVMSGREREAGYEQALHWYYGVDYRAHEIPRDEFWRAALAASKGRDYPKAFLAGWEKWWGYNAPPIMSAAVATNQSPKPNVPSKIAEWMAATTDRYVAFWQGFNEQHGQLVQRVQYGRALASKALVRFILYPLMVAVPIAVLSLGCWELVGHWHGPVHVASWPLAHMRHYTVTTLAHVRHWIAYSVLNSGHAVKKLVVAAGLTVGLFIVAAVGAIAMISLPIWGFAIWDRNHPYDPTKKTWLERHDVGPRPSQQWSTPARRDGVVGLYEDGWDAFWHRSSPVLTPVGKVLIVPLRIMGVLLWGLMRLTYYVSKGMGRGALGVGRSARDGALGAGRFMVMGHHTVKNRTCPKIEIVKDAQA